MDTVQRAPEPDHGSDEVVVVPAFTVPVATVLEVERMMELVAGARQLVVSLSESMRPLRELENSYPGDECEQAPWITCDQYLGTDKLRDLWDDIIDHALVAAGESHRIKPVAWHQAMVRERDERSLADPATPTDIKARIAERLTERSA